MTSNPEIAKIQESQKALAAEIESLNLQANQKRELFLKLQGIVEYLSSKEQASTEIEAGVEAKEEESESWALPMLSVISQILTQK